MAGDTDSPVAAEVIDPSSTYTHKLISLPEDRQKTNGRPDASASTPVIVVEHDEKSNTELLNGGSTISRPVSSCLDDEISSEVFLDKGFSTRTSGGLLDTAVSSTSTPMEDYAMTFCRAESATPSPLLDFDSRDDEDENIFPELADPAVDDDELVDLLIEQATLLSKTILRYLMIMT